MGTSCAARAGMWRTAVSTSSVLYRPANALRASCTVSIVDWAYLAAAAPAGVAKSLVIPAVLMRIAPDSAKLRPAVNFRLLFA